MKRGNKRVKVIDPCIQEMCATTAIILETIHNNPSKEILKELVSILDNPILIERLDKTREFASIKLWLDSGQILITKYDYTEKTLTIEFRKGGVYVYEDVSIKTWLDLLLTESPGSWVHKVLIKKKYKFKKIS